MYVTTLEAGRQDPSLKRLNLTLGVSVTRYWNKAMGTCKYEACGAPAQVDDEGACPKCAEIAAKVRDRIVQGLITRYQREGGPGRFAREAGQICAACDGEIRDESHRTSGERRFHEACHEIWMKG